MLARRRRRGYRCGLRVRWSTVEHVHGDPEDGGEPPARDGQPATRKTGSASSDDERAAEGRHQMLGSGRGVEKSALGIRQAPVAPVDGEDAAEDADDGADQDADAGRAGEPAEDDAQRRRKGRERRAEEATGACRVERGRGGGLHRHGENTRGVALVTRGAASFCEKSRDFVPLYDALVPRPRVLLVHGSVVNGDATWAAQRPLAERFELVVRTGAASRPAPMWSGRLRGRGGLARPVPRAGRAPRRAFVRRRDRAACGGAAA